MALRLAFIKLLILRYNIIAMMIAMGTIAGDTVGVSVLYFTGLYIAKNKS